MIIGLTGPNCAGKGETAKYLQQKGFAYFSLSDGIREELKRRGLAQNRENLIAVGNEVREKEGPAAWAKRTMLHVTHDRNVVIDSIRNPAEIDELRKNPHFQLWGINAPVETRFARAMRRGRGENASTLEEFKALEEQENSGELHKQQLKKCYAMADKTIENDSTFAKLHAQIDKILATAHKHVQ